MKSASPLFSYSLEGHGAAHELGELADDHTECFFSFFAVCLVGFQFKRLDVRQGQHLLSVSPAPPLHHPVKSLKGRRRREGGSPTRLISANVIGSEWPRPHLAAS